MRISLPWVFPGFSLVLCGAGGNRPQPYRIRHKAETAGFQTWGLFDKASRRPTQNKLFLMVFIYISKQANQFKIIHTKTTENYGISFTCIFGCGSAKSDQTSLSASALALHKIPYSFRIGGTWRSLCPVLRAEADEKTRRI